MLQQKLKQSQLQKLSPQQIQLMKLLLVPTARLQERIKEELETNPTLEEGSQSEEFGDEISSEADENAEDNFDLELDEYVEEYVEDDPLSYRSTHSQNNTEDKYERPPEHRSTFHDYLEEQWGMLNVSNSRQNLIAQQIIGNIDSDGYLRRDAMSICDDLLFNYNLDVEEIEVLEVLEQIQRFDPAGVGARDLQECLLIQIRQRIQADIHGNGSLTRKKHAEYILEHHFQEFSKKHYSRLQKTMEFDTELLRSVIGEILKLNPKPASAYQCATSSQPEYIIPDFIIDNIDGDLSVRLSKYNTPELHINGYYNEMLVAYHKKIQQKKITPKEKEAAVFIKNKIDSARWFVDALQQRYNTLYTTMYAILQYQKDFFRSGDQRDLKPMILKDIAELTQMDISTISRVVSSKYVQTEFGTKSLKEFFSEGIENADGEEVSTLEVKKTLENIVSAENKRKPLSDEKLRKALEEKGYPIARRTIAKYREQLGIPVARLRKEIV